MIARIAAILFIYVCSCVGWAILGASVWQRSNDASTSLRENVASIWGKPQTQMAPTAFYTKVTDSQSSVDEAAGKNAGEKPEERGHPRAEAVPVPLQQSRVNADLQLEYRRKGLVWFSTYGVQFQGTYRFENTSAEEREITIHFQLPDGQALYDGFSAKVNGKEVGGDIANSTLRVRERVPAGGQLELATGYRSQGLDSWTYSFGKGASRVNDFLLVMKTNFDDIDFPDSGLAPARAARPMPAGNCAGSTRVCSPDSTPA